MILSQQAFDKTTIIEIKKAEKELLLIYDDPFHLSSINLKIRDYNFIKYLLEKIEEAIEITTTTTTSTATINTVSTPVSNSLYWDTTTTPISNMPICDRKTYEVPFYNNDNNKVEIKAKEITLNGEKITFSGKEIFKKEENMKNNLGLNFDFGAITDSNIAVCPSGIAIKNKEGNYCYFDKNKGEIVDCTPFTFDSKKFLFKMPCAISAISISDIIMHHGVPMFVKGVEDEEGRILVIDISVGEEKYILPTRNMFGFNFVTKVVSLLDMQNCNASENAPFGNILPLLMLMEDGKDLDPMMLLMMGGINGSKTMDMSTMFQNPLMMYMMMKDDKDLSKMIPFILMSNK